MTIKRRPDGESRTKFGSVEWLGIIALVISTLTTLVYVSMSVGEIKTLVREHDRRISRVEDWQDARSVFP